MSEFLKTHKVKKEEESACVSLHAEQNITFEFELITSLQQSNSWAGSKKKNINYSSPTYKTQLIGQGELTSY